MALRRRWHHLSVGEGRGRYWPPYGPPASQGDAPAGLLQAEELAEALV